MTDGTRLVTVATGEHWRRRVAGEALPLRIGVPEPGLYWRRMVPKGPKVPARIWLEYWIDADGDLVSDETLRCEIGGKPEEPYEQWSWVCGQPIDQDEYDHLAKVHTWAQETGARHPNASPRQAVDLLATDLLF